MIFNLCYYVTLCRLCSVVKHLVKLSYVKFNKGKVPNKLVARCFLGKMLKV